MIEVKSTIINALVGALPPSRWSNGGYTMKKCTRCKVEKPLTAFYKNRTNKGGLQYECKQCHSEPALQRHTAHLRRVFGMSQEEFVLLLEKQNGVCAICQQGCKTGRQLAVDHDHATGDIRGLLCADCNLGLGRFQDDPKLLTKALAYLNPRGIPWILP